MMPAIKYLTLSLCLILTGGCTLLDVDTPQPVTEADVVVEIDFVESAPKDRFVIKNASPCNFDELSVVLDLSQSAGKLIFDTTDTGAGVEVFQPFEVAAGDITQASEKGVTDGDAKLSLRIGNLAPNDTASFTIDVDDTLTSSELGQIRVADSEINGGLVTVTAGEMAPATGTFDDRSRALVRLPACP